MRFWNLHPYRDYFCAAPFEDVDIGIDGHVMPCGCSAWMKTPIGSLAKSDWNDVWNGPVAQRVRASIHDGSFRYCREDLCPHLQNLNGMVQRKSEIWNPTHQRYIAERTTVMDRGPKSVRMSYDPTCNLTCPSCRSTLITAHGEEFDKVEAIHRRVMEQVFVDTEKVCCSGQGEPLSSRVYRDYLRNFDFTKNPKMTVELTTNAQLLTPKNWAALENSHGAIKSIHVSVNAGSAASYAAVQRGGEWETLLENLAFIRQLRESDQIYEFRFGFYVQENNFHELPEIVRIAKEYKVDVISMGMLQDWGVYSRKEFRALSVGDRRHPRHKEFLEVMQDPILQDPIVELGILSQFTDVPEPVKIEPPTTFDGFARELDLRRHQLDTVRTAINSFKDKACALFMVEDADGKTGIDRLLDATASAQASRGVDASGLADSFGTYLKSTHYPGTTTSLEMCLRKYTAQCYGDILEVLVTGQVRRLCLIGQMDLMNLDTGYDPRSEAIFKRRLQRASDRRARPATAASNS